MHTDVTQGRKATAALVGTIVFLAIIGILSGCQAPVQASTSRPVHRASQVTTPEPRPAAHAVKKTSLAWERHDRDITDTEALNQLYYCHQFASGSIAEQKCNIASRKHHVRAPMTVWEFTVWTDCSGQFNLSGRNYLDCRLWAWDDIHADTVRTYAQWDTGMYLVDGKAYGWWWNPAIRHA